MRLHDADALDMLAPMFSRKESTPDPRGVSGSRGFIRVEFALIVSLGTAAIFFGAGCQLVEDVTHPLPLSFMFVWLFGAGLWFAISVVRHAECLAIKLC